jgi:hypothetical protein
MGQKLALTDWSDITAFAKDILFKIMNISHETSDFNSMGSFHHLLYNLSYY